MFLFLLYLHTNRIIMSSKNRFMGQQWFPDSITFRKEGSEENVNILLRLCSRKTSQSHYALIDHPSGVSSEWFCTKYLSLGYATWSHTSLRCGKCLFVNVIHPFFFFPRYRRILIFQDDFFVSFVFLLLMRGGKVQCLWNDIWSDIF